MGARDTPHRLTIREYQQHADFEIFFSDNRGRTELRSEKERWRTLAFRGDWVGGLWSWSYVGYGILSGCIDRAMYVCMYVGTYLVSSKVH